MRTKGEFARSARSVSLPRMMVVMSKAMSPSPSSSPETSSSAKASSTEAAPGTAVVSKRSNGMTKSTVRSAESTRTHLSKWRRRSPHALSTPRVPHHTLSYPLGRSISVAMFRLLLRFALLGLRRPGKGKLVRVELRLDALVFDIVGDCGRVGRGALGRVGGGRRRARGRVSALPLLALGLLGLVGLGSVIEVEAIHLGWDGQLGSGGNSDELTKILGLVFLDEVVPLDIFDRLVGWVRGLRFVYHVAF